MTGHGRQRRSGRSVQRRVPSKRQRSDTRAGAILRGRDGRAFAPISRDSGTKDASRSVNTADVSLAHPSGLPALRLPLLVAAALAVSPALAHPHVWVTAKAEIVYGQDGRVAAVRHHWMFDEAYSAFAVQGLDANGDGKTTPDELADLARTNTDSLAEFGYFTTIKANGVKQALEAPRNESLSYDEGRLTLHFELPLKTPAANRIVLLDVYDPTFFVDFQTAPAADAVKLDGAPKGCSLSVTRPKALPVEKDNTLSEQFFQNLASAASFSAQFSSRSLAACP